MFKVQYNKTFSVFSQKAHRARRPTNSNTARRRALERTRAEGYRGLRPGPLKGRLEWGGQGTEAYILTLAGRELISRSCWAPRRGQHSLWVLKKRSAPTPQASGHQRQLHEPVGLTTGGRSAERLPPFIQILSKQPVSRHTAGLSVQEPVPARGKGLCEGCPGLFWDTSTAMCFL